MIRCADQCISVPPLHKPCCSGHPPSPKTNLPSSSCNDPAVSDANIPRHNNNTGSQDVAWLSIRPRGFRHRRARHSTLHPAPTCLWPPAQQSHAKHHSTPSLEAPQHRRIRWVPMAVISRWATRWMCPGACTAPSSSLAAFGGRKASSLVSS